MTGHDVLRRALSLLNYTDASGRTDSAQSAELYGRGVTVINAILNDIRFVQREGFTPITSLEEELPLDDATIVGVMVYGVAMMLAQSEADGDNQQMMATLYNQKRNAIPRKNGRVLDVVPTPCE